jgi:hypothetical protein
MKPIITADDAFEVCEGLAEASACATAPTAYGDGYRAAAQQIAAAIRAKRGGRAPSKLEQDLRDAEIEARTFARVIEAAVRVVTDAGEHTAGAEAVRALVGAFFSGEDLPPVLRATPRASAPRPAGAERDAAGVVTARGERAASSHRSAAILVSRVS